MMIIGCDFHPSWQQVSGWTARLEKREKQKLVHAKGEAERLYEQLAVPALIGMEATGNGQWFMEMVRGLGARSLDRGCGADPGQLRAQAEDGQAGCGAYSEAAAGRPLSATVDARARSSATCGSC